jgi:hypothetical protein
VKVQNLRRRMEYLQKRLTKKTSPGRKQKRKVEQKT